jgi:hypothetical protein
MRHSLPFSSYSLLFTSRERRGMDAEKRERDEKRREWHVKALLPDGKGLSRGVPFGEWLANRRERAVPLLSGLMKAGERRLKLGEYGMKRSSGALTPLRGDGTGVDGLRGILSCRLNPRGGLPYRRARRGDSGSGSGARGCGRDHFSPLPPPVSSPPSLNRDLDVSARPCRARWESHVVEA